MTMESIIVNLNELVRDELSSVLTGKVADVDITNGKLGVSRWTTDDFEEEELE